MVIGMLYVTPAVTGMCTLTNELFQAEHWVHVYMCIHVHVHVHTLVNEWRVVL